MCAEVPLGVFKCSCVKLEFHDPGLHDEQCPVLLQVKLPSLVPRLFILQVRKYNPNEARNPHVARFAMEGVVSTVPSQISHAI